MASLESERQRPIVNGPTTPTKAKNMTQKTSKTPTHTVRLLPASNAENTKTWPFVGAAWENRDGSFNIILNTQLPEGARVQIKKRKAVAERTSEAA